MTLIFLRIDNQLQCIVGLTFITGTKNFMVTTQSTKNDQIKTFLCSPGSTHYPFIEAILKNPPPNHIKSQNGKLWMNLDETSLRRSTDNKKFLRVNFNCKWTPISIQGEHSISTIFWIPDESTLHVRIQAIENLVAVKLIPITIQTEEFANLFVTLKISKKVDKGENQSLDDLLNFMTLTLGHCTRCHRSISYTLSLIYTTTKPILWTGTKKRVVKRSSEISKFWAPTLFKGLMKTPILALL